MLFGAVLCGRKSATLGNPQATDVYSLLVDVDVQLVNNSPSTYEDKQYEQTVIYSDKLFCQAVVEWLVATDQVRNSFFTAKSPA
jgi:hypothetical protein